MIIHVLSILHKLHKNQCVLKNVVLEIYKIIHILMKLQEAEYNVLKIVILLQINIYKLINAYILVNQNILNQYQDLYVIINVCMVQVLYMIN